MSYFLICVLSLILGVLLCPIVIFLRARKCEGWDNSNMTMARNHFGTSQVTSSQTSSKLDQHKRIKNESKNKKVRNLRIKAG